MELVDLTGSRALFSFLSSCLWYMVCYSEQSWNLRQAKEALVNLVVNVKFCALSNYDILMSRLHYE